VRRHVIDWQGPFSDVAQLRVAISEFEVAVSQSGAWPKLTPPTCPMLEFSPDVPPLADLAEVKSAGERLKTKCHEYRTSLDQLRTTLCDNPGNCGSEIVAAVDELIRSHDQLEASQGRLAAELREYYAAKEVCARSEPRESAKKCERLTTASSALHKELSRSSRVKVNGSQARICCSSWTKRSIAGENFCRCSRRCSVRSK